MKKTGSSKSISSPGRTDNKFPPPLMRFLRSNVSSKSRGRTTTRASPMMFMRNNNKNNNNTKLAIFETTQEEPTSPKVTCIGQVRGVRRSRNSSTSVRKQQKQDSTSSCSCCCCCCCNVYVKLQYLISLRILAFKKLVCCFQCGKKKVEVKQKVQKQQQMRVSTTSSSISESFENNNVVGGDNLNDPPKDALILTRCRSAPYRSSSLASRFWGSPLSNHTSDGTQSQSPPKFIQEPEEVEVVEEEDVVKSVAEGENGDLELGRSEESEEMQSSINGGSSNDKETNGGGGAYVHPLLLTRCKSEPARTGERLNPTRFSQLDSQI